MGLGLGSDGGVSLDMTGSRSRFDAFDARLRRTLTEHVSRAEAVEVSSKSTLYDIRCCAALCRSPALLCARALTTDQV